MKFKLLLIFLKLFPNFKQTIFSYCKINYLSHRMEQLEQLRGKLVTVYDIGANKGDWTELAKKFLPQSTFYLFEANKLHAPSLQKLGFRYFIGILSDTIREVKFYGKGSTGDSYYQEKTIHYQDLEANTVVTRTLDGLIQDEKLPNPDFIKLDTQGSELDILRGGSMALGHASLVYLECPILQYNAGAPRIQDYLDFFDLNGFFPIDICENHYFAGSLVQADFLFIRKELVPTLHQLR